MTGHDGHRVYLDWNATAPLRPEARAAMLAAMDVVGNPSSVHSEGRAAKAIVEKARGQVAALIGYDTGDVIFTSGATESAATVARHGWDVVVRSHLEHDAVLNGLTAGSGTGITETVNCHGAPDDPAMSSGWVWDDETWSGVGSAPRNPAPARTLTAITAADGETGTLPDRAAMFPAIRDRLSGLLPEHQHMALSDITQTCGRIAEPMAAGAPDLGLASAHKFGGPKGVGVLVAPAGLSLDSWTRGGGQEQGRRSGTENVVGIAGFGAAAEAAQRDLEAGVWDRVETLRDDLEDRLSTQAPDLIIFGKNALRLPNTSCFAVPGWRGETQVMQMDLAGFAISAGSACSSGKVNKASRVLMAMGFDEETASSAIRVSMGPTTTEAEVSAFADTWIDHHRKRRTRAA